MLITAGDQNPILGIKINMLKCSSPNRLRTVGYLSTLYETQDNLPVLQLLLGNQVQDGGSWRDIWLEATELPLHPTGPRFCE